MTQSRSEQRHGPRTKARTSDAPLCHVCGQPTDGRLDSTCRICSRPVHISWVQGRPESACSRIVSPQGCCGIAFVCNPCADGLDEPQP